MAWVTTSNDGRVVSVVEDERFARDDAVEVELPEGFDWSRIGDWVLAGGSLSRDGAQTAAEEAARQEADAEAGRAAAIAEGAADFFADGGKEAMERSIEEAAASGGADPQLKAIARLVVPTISFASVTATDVASIPDYIPEWSTLIGQRLAQNSPCRYNGTIYRASQDVTVQEVYPPDVAGESQYYPIEVANDGIIVYRTCHGQYDMVRRGERRHYPDADGPVYVALEDTAYSPDAYPAHWELVGGDA